MKLAHFSVQPGMPGIIVRLDAIIPHVSYSVDQLGIRACDETTFDADECLCYGKREDLCATEGANSAAVHSGSKGVCGVVEDGNVTSSGGVVVADYPLDSFNSARQTVHVHADDGGDVAVLLSQCGQILGGAR